MQIWTSYQLFFVQTVRYSVWCRVVFSVDRVWWLFRSEDLPSFSSSVFMDVRYWMMLQCVCGTCWLFRILVLALKRVLCSLLITVGRLQILLTTGNMRVIVIFFLCFSCQCLNCGQFVCYSVRYDIAPSAYCRLIKFMTSFASKGTV